MPVDHVGIGVPLGSDQPDVLGNGGVGRTGVLAVYDFMKVVRVSDIGGFHFLIFTANSMMARVWPPFILRE